MINFLSLSQQCRTRNFKLRSLTSLTAGRNSPILSELRKTLRPYSTGILTKHQKILKSLTYSVVSQTSVEQVLLGLPCRLPHRYNPQYLIPQHLDLLSWMLS